MASRVIQVILMVLLVVQGALASASGRVLCIPLGGHGEHHLCGADVGHGLSSPGACCDHPESPLDVVLAAHDECGCHVHVPVPGREQSPGNPKQSGGMGRIVSVAPVDSVVMAWGVAPVATLRVRSHWMEYGSPGQGLGLRTTRLII